MEIEFDEVNVSSPLLPTDTLAPSSAPRTKQNLYVQLRASPTTAIPHVGVQNELCCLELPGALSFKSPHVYSNEKQDFQENKEKGGEEGLSISGAQLEIVEKDNVETIFFRVGNKELLGKSVRLTNSIVLARPVQAKEEEDVDGVLEIYGVVKKKFVFESRPKACWK